MYPEYTGVAWMTVLSNSGLYDESMFNQLNNQLKSELSETMLTPYGFENTYAIAVPKAVAEKYNLKTISDLRAVAGQLTFGAESDYFSRADGFENLTNTYGLKFKDTMDLDVSLKYDAVEQGKIDVVEVYTTDGRLYGSDLVILDDDLNFFPSYYGVTIIREESLKEYPDLLPVLNKLNGKITTEDMMRMNYEVDVEKKDPKDVAHEFLVQKGLISGR